MKKRAHSGCTLKLQVIPFFLSGSIVLKNLNINPSVTENIHAFYYRKGKHGKKNFKYSSMLHYSIENSNNMKISPKLFFKLGLFYGISFKKEKMIGKKNSGRSVHTKLLQAGVVLKKKKKKRTTPYIVVNLKEVKPKIKLCPRSSEYRINIRFSIYTQENFQLLIETLLEREIKEFFEEESGEFKLSKGKESLIDSKKENQSIGWFEDYQKTCHPPPFSLKNYIFFEGIDQSIFPYHRTLNILPLFSFYRDHRVILNFLHKKRMHFKNPNYYSLVSIGLIKMLHLETKSLLNIRGILNNSTSENVEVIFSSKTTGIEDLKILILEIIEKLKKNQNFFRAYQKILYSYLNKGGDKKNIHRKFFLHLTKKKIWGKLKKLKNPEYSFQEEYQFIVVRISRISLRNQTVTFWKKNFEILSCMGFYFQLFFNFGGFSKLPVFPLKIVLSLLKKPFWASKESKIQHFCQSIRFFLKKRIRFNDLSIRSLFSAKLSDIPSYLKSSRILFLIDQTQNEFTQKKL